MSSIFGKKATADDQADEIKKALEKKREKLLEQARHLSHLITTPSTGWKEYKDLLTEYVEACKKRKAVTAIDRADEKTIHELRLLDHEIYILSWALNIPNQIIIRANKPNDNGKDDDQDE